MQPTIGLLGTDCVLVTEDQGASRLHNKGHFGVPQSGGSLKLHLIEAIYLVDKGRLSIKRAGGRGHGGPEVGPDALLSRAVKVVPNFEVRYSVYSDLKERGYLIPSPILLRRSDGTIPDWDLEVYSRGTQPTSRKRPQMRVFSVSERAPLVLGDIVERVSKATGSKYRVLLSLVDEEGDLTFYEVRTMEPKGKVRPDVKGSFEGQLLEDRVVLTDEGCMDLYDSGFYGKPMTGKLQLSFLEAAYLMKRGILSVRNTKTGRMIGYRTFVRTARSRQYDFNERLKAYTDLRDRGMVVKTGFKYGTHFRVYQDAPPKSHARYLMHAVPEGYRSTWPELSRAVRLAHGVRKEILFTRVMRSRGLQYIQFRRVRP